MEPQFDERLRLFDTGKIPAILDQGERAAEAIVPQLLRLLQGDRPALAGA